MMLDAISSVLYALCKFSKIVIFENYLIDRKG